MMTDNALHNDDDDDGVATMIGNADAKCPA